MKPDAIAKSHKPSDLCRNLPIIGADNHAGRYRDGTARKLLRENQVQHDIVIKNENISLTVSTLGAEMQSVRDREGTEFLWNGNSTYWTGRVPNLFPYIARLTNETYTLNGRRYHMGIHGFAANTEFLLEDRAENAAVFLLRDNKSTRMMYPFYFEFRVAYNLKGSRISILYSISNKGESPMYFGIGGHPGFSLPFHNGHG